MKALSVLALALLLATALLWLAGQRGWFKGHAPTDLGVREGRLKPPSTSPNSVSSQANLYPDHPQQAYATIAPFPLENRSPGEAMAHLAAVLRGAVGLTLVEQRSDYLRAEAQTQWLRFVDDLEFWFNPATGKIEVRSASRLGYSDLGKNRQRVEQLRSAYLQSH